MWGLMFSSSVLEMAVEEWLGDERGIIILRLFSPQSWPHWFAAWVAAIPLFQPAIPCEWRNTKRQKHELGMLFYKLKFCFCKACRDLSAFDCGGGDEVIGPFWCVRKGKEERGHKICIRGRKAISIHALAHLPTHVILKTVKYPIDQTPLLLFDFGDPETAFVFCLN